MNRELERSLEEGYEQEILNLLFFLRRLNLEIEGALLLRTLDSDCDFIRILALDFWVNCKNKVKRDRSEAVQLNKVVGDLENEFQNASYDDEHWLLLHEARMHKLLKLDASRGRTAFFFEEMQRLGVSFYQPE